jgi:hypothetical protein
MFGQAQQSTADRMIAAKGGTVTLVKTTSVYDEARLANVTTETRITAPAVIGPGRSLLPGSLVEKADIHVLVAARRFDVAPKVDDAVELGDVRYRVVRVTPTYAGNLVVMYDLEGVAR